MKKTCNKLLAFVLALAMALSVSVVAFASETTAPTSSTTVTALDGIASVNVEGVDAYYQYDDNTGSSVKYLLLPALPRPLPPEMNTSTR